MTDRESAGLKPLSDEEWTKYSEMAARLPLHFSNEIARLIATVKAREAERDALKAEVERLKTPRSQSEMENLDLLCLVDGWPHPHEVRRIISELRRLERALRNTRAVILHDDNVLAIDLIDAALTPKETDK